MKPIQAVALMLVFCTFSYSENCSRDNTQYGQKEKFQNFTQKIIECCFCRAQLKMCFVALLSLCDLPGLSDPSEVTQLKMASRWILLVKSSR